MFFILKCSEPLFLRNHTKLVISQLCCVTNLTNNLPICWTELAKRTEDAAIKAGEYLKQKVSKEPFTIRLPEKITVLQPALLEWVRYGEVYNHSGSLLTTRFQHTVCLIHNFKHGQLLGSWQFNKVYIYQTIVLPSTLCM